MEIKEVEIYPKLACEIGLNKSIVFSVLCNFYFDVNKENKNDFYVNISVRELYFKFMFMKKDTVSKYMRWLKLNNYIDFKYCKLTNSYLYIITELGVEYYKNK